MSTSFVEFRGYGFWSFDPYLEKVLAQVAERIQASTTQGWLANLGDHWREQSTGIYRAWIHPKLDEFIVDDERRDALLQVLGEAMSQANLARSTRENARLLDLLLRGELETTASSPLDYMFQGEDSIV